MLLTIAISAIYSLRYADTSKIMTGITMIYGLGLAFASLWNIFAGKPIKMAYLVVFSLVFLGSLIVLLFEPGGLWKTADHGTGEQVAGFLHQFPKRPLHHLHHLRQPLEQRLRADIFVGGMRAETGR